MNIADRYHSLTHRGARVGRSSAQSRSKQRANNAAVILAPWVEKNILHAAARWSRPFFFAHTTQQPQLLGRTGSASQVSVVIAETGPWQSSRSSQSSHRRRSRSWCLWGWALDCPFQHRDEPARQFGSCPRLWRPNQAHLSLGFVLPTPKDVFLFQIQLPVPQPWSRLVRPQPQHDGPSILARYPAFPMPLASVAFVPGFSLMLRGLSSSVGRVLAEMLSPRGFTLAFTRSR